MFRRMHMAVISPYRHRPVLFPEDDDIEDAGLLAPTTLQMNIIPIFDSRVRSNPNGDRAIAERNHSFYYLRTVSSFRTLISTAVP